MITSWNVLQTHEPLTQAERDEIPEEWQQTETDWIALAAGTARVAMPGAGVMIGVLELRIFRGTPASESIR